MKVVMLVEIEEGPTREELETEALTLIAKFSGMPHITPLKFMTMTEATWSIEKDTDWMNLTSWKEYRDKGF